MNSAHSAFSSSCYYFYSKWWSLNMFMDSPNRTARPPTMGWSAVCGSCQCGKIGPGTTVIGLLFTILYIIAIGFSRFIDWPYFMWRKLLFKPLPLIWLCICRKLFVFMFWSSEQFPVVFQLSRGKLFLAWLVSCCSTDMIQCYFTIVKLGLVDE